ncbi:hypothetical protein [Saccharopolyspora phatthalungensis]|uniref:Uncharacterized protein n=1 Tax=Saccharopolyspora phatthalungensis TaxID=664693 RepID=A0A840QGD4_9PSEU|nr:hypothetical protein [Saccharopolyspora phatthalungensis]MBB5159536.1 hypothetical protein [Saccharopolyspora phatthalungensis]
MRTALAAWRSIEPEATHHLVVQDDMILSDGLVERARRAASAMPDAALSFFSIWDSRNGGAVRLGALAGARWVAAASEYTPSAVLLLPRSVAAGFVEFAERRTDTWPDDILMRQYLREAGVASYVSVPNAAEHADLPSISGNRFRGPRKSVCWPDEDATSDEDALLTGMSVIPFYKLGKAQCSVRMSDTQPPRWHDIPTERYLASVGLPRTRLEREFTPSGRCDAAIEWQVWLTGLAMGVVRHIDPGVSLVNPHGVCPDPKVVAEAIRTIGPGGLCHNTPAGKLAQVSEILAEVAERGIRAGAGHAADIQARTTLSGGPMLRIGVAGNELALVDFLVRGLRDHGWNATPFHTKDHECDVILDVGAVASVPPGEVPQAQGSIRLIWNPRDQRRSRSQLLHVGEVYGPGCSPRSRIGRMVFAAVLGRAIHVDEHPDTCLRPIHVEDLVKALHEVLRTRPVGEHVRLPHPAAHTIAEIAECIRNTVRPVPIEFGCQANARPTAESHSGIGEGNFVELGFGLHTFAQWLAYETRPLPLESHDASGSVITG